MSSCFLCGYFSDPLRLKRFPSIRRFVLFCFFFRGKGKNDGSQYVPCNRSVLGSKGSFFSTNQTKVKILDHRQATRKVMQASLYPRLQNKEGRMSGWSQVASTCFISKLFPQKVNQIKLACFTKILHKWIKKSWMRVSTDVNIKERYRQPLPEQSKRLFSGSGIWPELCRARFGKTQIYWRDLTVPREVAWDSPKPGHGMWYWERKQYSG